LVSTTKGVIIDVRTKMEYESHHIKGAINIKMNDILKGADKMIQNIGIKKYQ
jgi:rhodanese-related sulfurtransferase